MQDKYEAAKRRALARKPFLKTDGRYLLRDQAHDRGRLRSRKLLGHLQLPPATHFRSTKKRRG